MEEKLTSQQRKALHLWFTQLADVLREQGLDMKAVLTEVDIMPTKESVKELIFKPILLAMYGKDSTMDMAKQKEIDDIYDVICKHFAERGVQVPPFPSVEELINYDD